MKRADFVKKINRAIRDVQKGVNVYSCHALGDSFHGPDNFECYDNNDYSVTREESEINKIYDNDLSENGYFIRVNDVEARGEREGWRQGMRIIMLCMLKEHCLANKLYEGL